MEVLYKQLFGGSSARTHGNDANERDSTSRDTRVHRGSRMVHGTLCTVIIYNRTKTESFQLRSVPSNFRSIKFISCHEGPIYHSANPRRVVGCLVLLEVTLLDLQTFSLRVYILSSYSERCLETPGRVDF